VLHRRTKKPLVFLCAVSPFLYFCWLFIQYANGDPFAFGADPGKEIVLYLGEWALILLMATLALTPLQSVMTVQLVVYRRMLGLFSFFYAVLHMSSYFVFLLGLDFAGFWADLEKRPYITVGALALFGMTPLAITSTKGMQRKLGSSWKKLHRIIYPVSFLVIIHFFLQTRSDFTEVLMYSALLAWLMGFRAFKSKRFQESINTLKST
jgi:sulfoxide reductase heme-binding subunit YedZ